MGFASGRWTAIGARLDSAGVGEGEERGPAALRAAGLIDGLDAADRGDISTTIGSSVRDPASGLIGYRDVLAASRELSAGVTAIAAAGGRPLVLGGDCTLLIGALAGARLALAGRPLGLAFIDGHLDCYDGRTSPTGECADMELAIVTGGGPGELADLAGPAPIIDPAAAIVAGYRSEPNPETVPAGPFTPERYLIDPRIEAIEAAEITDPAALGERIERQLSSAPGRFWLHLDVDVLDPQVLPAVSYPEPGGLDWEQALALVRPLGVSRRLIGASVADFNPDLDPDGRYGRRLAELVAAALG